MYFVLLLDKYIAHKYINITDQAWVFKIKKF